MAYKSSIKRVNGKAKGDIFLFAISTCGWCGLTKKLFNDLGLEYSYVDVDLLEEVDRKEVENELKKYKSDMSFPKIIINGILIDGFDEEKIRAEIKKWKN